jgi:hypothetical protein
MTFACVMNFPSHNWDKTRQFVGEMGGEMGNAIHVNEGCNEPSGNIQFSSVATREYLH